MISVDLCIYKICIWGEFIMNIFVIPDLYGIIHVMKIHILKYVFVLFQRKMGLFNRGKKSSTISRGKCTDS